MRVNHIKGPAGSGKTTMLRAIFAKFGKDRCLFVGGDSTTSGIIKYLDILPQVDTILIDDFDGRRISLKKIAKHVSAPRLVVHVAHVAGGV